MNYKVIFGPCLGSDSLYGSEHETHEEAEAVLNAVANYTLMLHEDNLMQDHSNFGCVMKRDSDGDWIELESE